MSSSMIANQRVVLMEHPPKQGLKHFFRKFLEFCMLSFNGTSTKTRIETVILLVLLGLSQLF